MPLSLFRKGFRGIAVACRILPKLAQAVNEGNGYAEKKEGTGEAGSGLAAQDGRNAGTTGKGDVRATGGP